MIIFSITNGAGRLEFTAHEGQLHAVELYDHQGYQVAKVPMFADEARRFGRKLTDHFADVDRVAKLELTAQRHADEARELRREADRLDEAAEANRAAATAVFDENPF